MTFPPSPSRRTFLALAFITVWPIVTWPSPATTTSPFLRTDRIVVPCHALSIECSDVMIAIMWDFTARDQDIVGGVCARRRLTLGLGGLQGGPLWIIADRKAFKSTPI